MAFNQKLLNYWIKTENLSYTNIGDLLLKYKKYPISLYLEKYSEPHICILREKHFLLKLCVFLYFDSEQQYDINAELLYNCNNFLSSKTYMDNQSLWFGKLQKQTNFLLLNFDIFSNADKKNILISQWYLGNENYDNPFIALSMNKNISRDIKYEFNKEIINILNNRCDEVLEEVSRHSSYIVKEA